MTTIISERRKGVTQTCDAACYDAKSDPSQCECICGGFNHRKGVSGLFGEDVPRKQQYLEELHAAFMTELRQRAATSGVVYGGIRLDPGRHATSPVELYVSHDWGASTKQILHQCARFKRRNRDCQSQDGFNWGMGRGPAALELSRYLMAHALGDWYYFSTAAHRPFVTQYLNTPSETWFITKDQIQKWNRGRINRSLDQMRRAG